MQLQEAVSASMVLTIAPHRRGKANGIMSEIATLENINARLTSLESGQLVMNTALGLVIDTLHTQTNLLRELADLAADEPGPSPILQSIDDLTAAVVEMGENVDDVGAMIADLPDKIGAAIDGGK
jgi:hypothetical protein